MTNDIIFPESMEKTEGLDAQEVLKIHDDYIRYIVERIRFAFNGYTNKKKFIEAIEDVVEDGPLAKELTNEKSAREQAIIELNEKLKDAGGLFSTVDPATNIIYMHDKPEEPGRLPPYTNSKYVVMVSNEGIAVSDEGGAEGTYKFAIQLNGEAILEKIYAEGIDAKYIKANTLSADKIEATEGTYNETASWNSMNLAFAMAYIRGNISLEDAIRAGSDVNGDGQVDFFDLALMIDALLDRVPWDEEGGTFKAQIKCENPFSAMSVSDNGKTAFSAGIHGAYMANGYVGDSVKVYDNLYNGTQESVTLDKYGLRLRNPHGDSSDVPYDESYQYGGLEGKVELTREGLKFIDKQNSIISLYPRQPLSWQNFTPAAGTASPFQIAKYLNVVELYGGLTGLSSATSVNLGTLPYKPRNSWSIIPTYQTAAPYLQNGTIWIDNAGAMTLYKSSASTGCYFNGTFVCQ